ncbi:Alpha-ribazole phosphatase [Cupriavidus sp. H18C1]|uniref:histidine phosphatase family protein n=1 Tax=Cupriavidus sp. H18C1 TaxID=3241601 RepID=UPI003BB8D5FE
MDLVLIRHAHPAVDDGVCYGRLDLSLAEPMSPPADAIVNAASAAASANGVPPPARIVCSPAQRARVTAQRIAQAYLSRAGGTAPAISSEARLHELDFGAWEGQRWDAVPREGLDQWAADLMDACPHGGESARSAYARVAGWADSLQASPSVLASVSEPEPESCLWVVGHAGPMRMLAAHWLGLPLSDTLDWQLGWGASCGFRLDPGAVRPARLLWWNRTVG